jgi:hypothetical protein
MTGFIDNGNGNIRSDPVSVDYFLGLKQKRFNFPAFYYIRNGHIVFSAQSGKTAGADSFYPPVLIVYSPRENAIHPNGGILFFLRFFEVSYNFLSESRF